MSEKYYRIQLEDGSVMPGVWTQGRAEEIMRHEEGPCVLIALSESELRAQQEKDLRLALGFDEDDLLNA